VSVSVVVVVTVVKLFDIDSFVLFEMIAAAMAAPNSVHLISLYLAGSKLFIKTELSEVEELDIEFNGFMEV
jgi:hypothetical protein